MKNNNDNFSHPKFHVYNLETKELEVYNDGNFESVLSGFDYGGELVLPQNYSHFGIVTSGEIELNYTSCEKEIRRTLSGGDFFSVSGKLLIKSNGQGMVVSAKEYSSLNVFGGPIEEQGRLRYIDGCTDSLLIAPIRNGDPCLNYLHFPKNIVQTPHTHPSVRIGIVLDGEGVAIIEDTKIPLEKNKAFLLETGAIHSFNTEDSDMKIIVFHPDSDVGVTDDDHPMINRTIVNGVSAKEINEIRTK
jgi:quercetin dioxygenase-like cupin family protein